MIVLSFIHQTFAPFRLFFKTPMTRGQGVEGLFSWKMILTCKTCIKTIDSHFGAFNRIECLFLFIYPQTWVFAFYRRRRLTNIKNLLFLSPWIKSGDRLAFASRYNSAPSGHMDHYSNRAYYLFFLNMSSLAWVKNLAKVSSLTLLKFTSNIIHFVLFQFYPPSNKFSKVLFRQYGELNRS